MSGSVMFTLLVFMLAENNTGFVSCSCSRFSCRVGLCQVKTQIATLTFYPRVGLFVQQVTW